MSTQKQAYQLTEAQAKAAGITKIQADGEGGDYIKAFKRAMGDALFTGVGDLVLGEKIIQPDGRVLKGPDTPKEDKASAKKVAAKKNEYTEALDIVKGFERLTGIPAWQSLRKHVQALQAQADDGLHTGAAKDFPMNQSTWKAALAMVDPIRAAIDNLNNMSKPGEFALWGEPTAKASFDEETWKITIAMPDPLSKEVQKLARESGKTKEGKTDKK